MRKIPAQYENPLDDALLDAADAALPLARATRLTPNQITVGSIAFKVGAVWALAEGRPWAFLASDAAGVFLDYVDGHLARADGEVTPLGDALDHGSDLMHGLAVAGLAAYRLGARRAALPMLALAALAVAQAVHLGCQQKYYHAPGGGSESLDGLRKLCAGDPRRWMRATRFFGVGTFQLALAIVALYSMA